MRQELGLDVYADFAAMTGGDQALADAFAEVYDDVHDVDLWTGGLAETPFLDAMVGETFYEILAGQFTRLRDGDRFFYLAHLDDLRVFDADLAQLRLSDVIRRNTGITSLYDNVFAYEAAVSEPGTGAMLFLGLVALAAARRAPGVLRAQADHLLRRLPRSPRTDQRASTI